MIPSQKPYFISPLSSQLTVKQIELIFFSHNSVFLSDLLFSCLLSYVPPLVWAVSPFLSHLPFCQICHGKVKKLSCSLSFCVFSVEKKWGILFFYFLWFKVNEAHISSAWSYMTGRGWAGLSWENKYCGRSNFVIFIWQGSVCVLLDRIHYTNT